MEQHRQERCALILLDLVDERLAFPEQIVVPTVSNKYSSFTRFPTAFQRLFNGFQRLLPVPEVDHLVPDVSRELVVVGAERWLDLVDGTLEVRHPYRHLIHRTIQRLF